MGYNVVPPPPTCLFAPPTIDLSNSGLEEFQQPEFKGYRPKAMGTHPNAQRNMVPRAVLMKTGPKPFNTAKTVNTALPKSIVFGAKPMSRFSKSAQSTVKRPYQSKTVLTNKIFSQKVNIAKAQAVNTARPKAVNTARPNSAVINTIRANQENAVKASACWETFPISQISRSLMEDMLPLVEESEEERSLVKDKQIEHLMLNASPLKYCLRGGYLCQYAVKHGWKDIGPPVKVGDEAVHKELGDRMERAATTTSSLEAEQDSDAQTRFEAASKQSNDPSLSRVNTLGNGKDNMRLIELMAHSVAKFSQTAALSIIEDGVMEINATIDGRVKTITEASIRRYLKLEDFDGISTLPTAEIFEQLVFMGYVTTSDGLTFQKGHFSPQWKFLIHTILHCLSPKKTAWEHNGKELE
ncbi:hypothetical protein Tco_0941951 [Tanacetum coccineum]|uniref:Uncharacterized protein n=1 Tax=Tanacetum coccineum TaxID=301880 RepID=A0ABQ5DSC3_9ASTR